MTSGSLVNSQQTIGSGGMCLGIPGQVVRWLDRDPLLALAEIDFGGVRKRCHMACVPAALEGDYVLVHAGIALSVLDRAAAEQLLADLGGVAKPQSLGETST